ncbi:MULTISPECIES: transketolase [unclassified Brevundimonas]|uniref:transketolase n=1 Tax=unclassified Brevundimonas TaxID=2622653 RepID=UPI000E90C71F|nr:MULTISPECIES: transketolase [unclassified Brevundimonas]MCK6105568.1 transketolase [Brevundimonas sp. EYE_349]HBI20672.1 transketolase [Brevundimonas sp.]
MTDAKSAPKATPEQMANAIRVLAMDGVEKAKSGHPGMPMGMADVATVLFSKFLKFDASRPDWADRDRFILSAGHGSMLIYALLHLTGYKAATKEELSNFRQWGSKTAGHPEYGHMPGVEVTTGPLGQGLATSVGFAMAERHLAAKYGDDLVDHRTWVIAGDGCLMEGVSQEAIALAGRYKLNKLTVLWDDNEITIDGKVSLSDAVDQKARFKAAGWAVKAVDGHDMKAIKSAMQWAIRQDKPVLLACKTKIGKGAATMEGSHKTHGAALGAAEIAATRLGLAWDHDPFEMPETILSAWHKVGRRGAKDRKKWEARLAASSQAADFTRAMKGDLPEAAFDALNAKIAELVEAKPAQATRQSSGAALDELFAAIPELVGGSADLTGSNNTFVKGTPVLDAPTYEGRYVNWGIREFGMAAAMNGLALHGGVIPYGGTFMVFSDYSRPAIRLGALMGVRAIHVLTHDSIGLGEDGPTHQPVEHLAALRAIPNLLVFRPADTIEAMECWQIALQTKTAPSALALSRQKTPAVRTAAATENLSAKGAYEIKAANGEAKVTLFGTGTELALALDAAATLEAEGTPTRVVSVPSFELFEQQDAAYQAAVIGRGTVRVAVEAAIKQGWERFIGEDGAFIGMSSFGASAPAEVLYEKFGITSDAVVAAVKARL